MQVVGVTDLMEVFDIVSLLLLACFGRFGRRACLLWRCRLL